VLLKKAHQVGEGDLGGVGAPAEHGFAVKGPPDGHAVEPAGELAVDPGFDAVGVAEFVHADVGGLDGGVIQVPPPGSRGSAQARMTAAKSWSRRTSK
jgi:hypothetical protein